MVAPVAWTPAGGSTFVVELDRFSGPLDLLLHLIRQQDLDIFDIPIARITDQFLSVVRAMEAHDLDQAGEFLEVAATLIRIKVQLLLPRREEEQDEDPRAELVRRLLEYEQIREITQRLSVAEAERGRRFGRGHRELTGRPRTVDLPLETEWPEVMEAALGVRTPEKVDRRHRVTTRPVAMEDKIDLILSTLREGSRVEFGRLVAPWPDRMHGVMTFLAGLELTRRQQILLRQLRPFTELWLYRREDEAGVAAFAEELQASGAKPPEESMDGKEGGA
jgi:segregation and condensation protein A